MRRQVEISLACNVTAIGALGLPTAIVQEGGYMLQTIGPLVRATLEGFEESPSSR